MTFQQKKISSDDHLVDPCRFFLEASRRIHFFERLCAFYSKMNFATYVEVDYF